MTSSPTPFDLAAVAARSPPLPPTAVASSSASAVAAPAPVNPFGAPVAPSTCLPPKQLEALFPGPESKATASINDGRMLLELTDGSAYEGYSFGAEKSISGECVFQTGEFALF